jgi:hypothetical protein
MTNRTNLLRNYSDLKPYTDEAVEPRIRSNKGIASTRPARFERATSRSGGERSIH